MSERSLLASTVSSVTGDSCSVLGLRVEVLTSHASRERFPNEGVGGCKGEELLGSPKSWDCNFNDGFRMRDGRENVSVWTGGPLLLLLLPLQPACSEGVTRQVSMPFVSAVSSWTEDLSTGVTVGVSTLTSTAALSSSMSWRTNTKSEPSSPSLHPTTKSGLTLRFLSSRILAQARSRFRVAVADSCTSGVGC